jgi:Major Facilitator Superfamily
MPSYRDLTFILVSTPHTPFSSHGHKLLILAPFIEGLLGGWSTLQSATTSYISDCTSDGSRAQIFSRFTGVFYIGLSVGPAIGAFLIKHPFMPLVGRANLHPIQNVTSVFWTAIFCSFINLLLTTFVFPESLPKEKRQGTAVVARDAEGDDSPESHDKRDRDWVGLGIIKGFLSPLAIFLPKVVQGVEGRGKKDWSLTFLALALFGYMLSTVCLIRPWVITGSHTAIGPVSSQIHVRRTRLWMGC